MFISYWLMKAQDEGKINGKKDHFFIFDLNIFKLS